MERLGAWTLGNWLNPGVREQDNLNKNTGKAQKWGSSLDDRGAKGPPVRDATCKSGHAWMAATVQGTLDALF